MNLSDDNLSIDGSVSRTIGEILASANNGEVLTRWRDCQCTSRQWPKNKDAIRAMLKVADALRLEGRFSESVELAETCLESAFALHAEAQVSSAYLVLGSISHQQGSIREARESFSDAAAAARRCGDTGTICRSALWLSYLEKTVGHLGIALEYAEQCLKIADQSSQSRWQIAACRSIGIVAAHRGDFQLAIKTLNRGVELAIAEEDGIERARTRLVRAVTSSRMEQLEQAKSDILMAREQLSNGASIRDQAITYEYEAVLNLNQGDLDAAEVAIKKAVEISLNEFPDGDMTSQSYRIWAEIDVKRSDFKAAKEHAMDALGVARRVGSVSKLGPSRESRRNVMTQTGKPRVLRGT